jgi:hypothetical protein
VAAVKSLTREQLQSRKDKAARFVRDVLDDPDRADEIEDEDLESYADRRGFELIDNPRRVEGMANGGNGRTKQDLLDEIDDLRADNQDLKDQLDAIQDIISGPEEEEEEDDGGDGDDADDGGQ